MAPKLSSTVWRKSSHSGGNGECVELAYTPVVNAVRDSKNPSGPALVFDQSALHGFLVSVKSGALPQ